VEALAAKLNPAVRWKPD